MIAFIRNNSEAVIRRADRTKQKHVDNLRIYNWSTKFNLFLENILITFTYFSKLSNFVWDTRI